MDNADKKRSRLSGLLYFSGLIVTGVISTFLCVVVAIWSAQIVGVSMKGEWNFAPLWFGFWGLIVGGLFALGSLFFSIARWRHNLLKSLLAVAFVPICVVFLQGLSTAV